MKKESIVTLDIIGISSASMCMVHCFLFPILSIFPFGFSENHWIDVFFACIGMLVVSKIARSKAPKKVKLILITSISIVMVGVALELVWEVESKMILIGGIGMIIGHYCNYKSHSKKA